MGIAARVLRQNGMAAEAKEMCIRDRKCIEDFLLWLTNTSGSSPSTYNQRLCAIHAFFDYVMTEEPTYMEQCILILKIPSMVSPDPVSYTHLGCTDL